MLGLTIPSLAWLKIGVSDAELVSRAEIIAVAHVKPGSVEYFANEGRGFDHRAVLILTEVLKGKPAAKEIPILVRYGLTVDFPGNTNRSKSGFGWRMISNGKTQHVEAPGPNTIQVHDFNPGTWPTTHLVVTDATEGQLWFLHRQVHAERFPDALGLVGVKDSADIQPLTLREYFRAYLAAQPEGAVRKVVEQQPALARRAAVFLGRFASQRTISEDEAKNNVAQILPVLMDNWQHSHLISGLLASGPAALPQLRDFMTDPNHEGRTGARMAIMSILGELRDRASVPLLTDLLAKHEKFWATQTLEPGWWSDDYWSDATQQRHALYHEVNAAVRALGQIGDKRAKAVVEQTKRVWGQRDSNGNSQIVEGATSALTALERGRD